MRTLGRGVGSIWCVAVPRTLISWPVIVRVESLLAVYRVPAGLEQWTTLAALLRAAGAGMLVHHGGYSCAVVRRGHGRRVRRPESAWRAR